MWCTVELPDVHHVVLVLQNGGFVVVHVEIIGCTEDGHDTWEACRPSLSVHPVASVLSLMSANDGQQVVLLQEGACGRVRKEVGTPSDMVVDEELGSLFLAKFFKWICPENVTHQAMGGRLAESIDLNVSATAHPNNAGVAYPFEVIQGM